MAIGPVQLVVLGFNQPAFRGEILAELERLRESDTVRLIDAIAVYKDAEGEVLTLERSDLSEDEAADFGAAVGALIGLGAAGEEGMLAGAEAGAAATADGVHVLSDEETWDVIPGNRPYRCSVPIDGWKSRRQACSQRTQPG